MEEWRKVPGYDYEISISTKEGKCRNTKTKKELSKRTTNGYILWHFSKNGIVKTYQAARWIAIAFSELVENEYFEGAEIDHKDTDRLNNHPSNLRWVTAKGNMNNPLTRKHLSEGLQGHHPTEATRKKLSESHKGNRPWMLNKISVKRVAQYTKDGVFVAEYPSMSQAQRDTGIERVNILNACRNKRPSAGGFVWKYV